MGEQKLGELPGILATRIGALKEAPEVVEVDYDAKVLPTGELMKRADAMGFKALPPGEVLDTRTVQQYHLAQRPEYSLLPLTALQATRMNAAIASRQDPDRFLSPGQKALKAKLEAVLKGSDAKRKDALKALKPDRSPEGLPRYAVALTTLLDAP